MWSMPNFKIERTKASQLSIPLNLSSLKLQLQEVFSFYVRFYVYNHSQNSINWWERITSWLTHTSRKFKRVDLSISSLLIIWARKRGQWAGLQGNLVFCQLKNYLPAWPSSKTTYIYFPDKKNARRYKMQSLIRSWYTISPMDGRSRHIYKAEI